MTNHEKKRLHLQADLIRAIGEESTETLMTSLPPFDWSQVATKEDLRVLITREEFRNESSESREEFRKLFNENQMALKDVGASVALLRAESQTALAEFGKSYKDDLLKLTNRIQMSIAGGFTLLGVVIAILQRIQ